MLQGQCCLGRAMGGEGMPGGMAVQVKLGVGLPCPHCGSSSHGSRWPWLTTPCAVALGGHQQRCGDFISAQRLTKSKGPLQFLLNYIYRVHWHAQVFFFFVS